ncbi:hypothetical protein V6N13_147565 [Hibiscus sabdariffa]|uniref:Uncharacterized protein n=1 Tax=Hibiscus sabdariffa TaxID=183260 RepID=A0ABR2TVZ7_9ROSI
MGFAKSKLANSKSSSYVSKPSSHQQFSSSKVGPSSLPNRNGSPRGFIGHNRSVYSSMEKVSSTETGSSSSSPSNSANLVNQIGYHNPTWGGDEDVDEKATIYISYVRKRLLEES